MAKYSDLLKDPRWQKKRLEILQRDNWECKHCGEDKETLNVHHKFYTHGLMPWEYQDSAYITLCNFCHESEHEYKDILNGLIQDFLSMGHNYKLLYHFLDEHTDEILKYADL